MGVFVLNRLSHVSHFSDVGLTDFARAHRCHAGADSEAFLRLPADYEWRYLKENAVDSGKEPSIPALFLSLR